MGIISFGRNTDRKSNADCKDNQEEAPVLGSSFMQAEWDSSPKIVEKLVCENEVVTHETERIIKALKQSIANQEAIYGLLTEQLQREKEENRRLTEIIRRQHETLEKFQNDVFYRAQKDMILEIIRIADEIESIKEFNVTGSPLMSELGHLSEFIDGGLAYSAVNSYREADGTTKNINPRRQKFIDTVIPTNDPQKDGMIASYRPGYVWRLPWLVANTDVQLANMMEANKASQTYEVMIRPELVARMEFREPSDDMVSDVVAKEEGVGFSENQQ